MALVRADGTRHSEVLDGGAVDVAKEGGALIIIVANRGGDGVLVTVEGAAEGVLLRAARNDAHLMRDADVIGQFQELATVAVATTDIYTEGDPFVSIADQVGLFLRACAAEGRHVEGYNLLSADVAGRGHDCRTLNDELLALSEGDALKRAATIILQTIVIDEVAGGAPAERQRAAVVIVVTRLF